MQLEHACELLLQSELFTFHSERMCDNAVDQVQKVRDKCAITVIEPRLIIYEQATDPHLQLILYNVLLFYGRKKANFLRTHKRWQPLIPLLIDNILVDCDPGVHWSRNAVIPIEAKIRILSVRLLYEVCRVQKFAHTDLSKSPSSLSSRWYPHVWTGIFKDSFVNYLFDLVEQTRDIEDETFNYSVIKLIVSLQISPALAFLKVLAGGPERTIYGSTAPYQFTPQGQGRGERKASIRKSCYLRFDASAGVE